MPAALFGKEISIATVIIIILLIFLVVVLGSHLFKKGKNPKEELELQLNKFD